MHSVTVLNKTLIDCIELHRTYVDRKSLGKYSQLKRCLNRNYKAERLN